MTAVFLESLEMIPFLEKIKHATSEMITKKTIARIINAISVALLFLLLLLVITSASCVWTATVFLV